MNACGKARRLLLFEVQQSLSYAVPADAPLTKSQVNILLPNPETEDHMTWIIYYIARWALKHKIYNVTYAGGKLMFLR